MDIINTIDEMRDVRRQWQQARETVALVPTMGNLHRGHLHLVEQARQKADRVVVSIFVNPLQFGEGEDFKDYPRTFKDDIDHLAGMNVDAVFAPNANEVYGDGFKTIVEIKGLSDILCGEYRPGHFVGVATIVNKLFNMVQPDIALFGKKDFQQLLVIKYMVRDLNIPVEIEAVETQRDEDGLALSSRNAYLNAADRLRAPALYTILDKLRSQIQQGERNWRDMERAAVMVLEETGFRAQYVSIRRADTLETPPLEPTGLEIVILAAAFLGNTRLIDNVIVSLPG